MPTPGGGGDLALVQARPAGRSSAPARTPVTRAPLRGSLRSALSGQPLTARWPRTVAVCSADLADHGADAMSWIVQCGRGTVYGTDDPLILVCPNAECTWDFAPRLQRCPPTVPEHLTENALPTVA